MATLFLSNRQEKLFQWLKSELFSKDEPPFARRGVVVPSRAIKNWLFSTLAHELSIASGIEILFPTELYQLFSSPIPTSWDLTFLIEEELHKIAREKREDPLFAPLLPALASSESIQELALHLGKKFSLLGHAALAHHEKWQKGPITWQEALWQQLFSEKNPYADLFLGKKEKAMERPYLSLHLFGLPTFLSSEFAFFERVGQKIPLSIYYLSPSFEFFGDNLSIDEIEAIIAEKKPKGEARLIFEESFSGQNPLLGELGRVKRHFLNEAIENNIPLVEEYEKMEEKTTLTRLQADLLTNRKKEWQGVDETISFHTYSTHLQEIEGLFSQLAKLISEKGIEPKDILVVAPDISCYLPFIPASFGKKIDYRISDLPLGTLSPLMVGLSLLFSLEKERWQKEVMIDLLSQVSLQKKEQFSESDVKKIKEWIERASIHFGYNDEHVARLLPDACEKKSTHTWVEGVRRLFSELAACDRMEMTEAPLVGRLATLLDRLYIALKPLSDNSQRSMAGWCDYLLFLADHFFDESLEELSRLLKPLKRERKLTFSSFLFYFEKRVAEERRTLRDTHLQAVTFSSLFAMRTIPAKVIALIGLNEEAFPRKEESSLLVGMRLDKMEYTPSAPDVDRSLFLEAILSAREHLLLSYIGRDPIENRELLPSPLLSTLHSYLGHPPIRRHEKRGCDPVKTVSLSHTDSIAKENKNLTSVKPLYIDIRELNQLVRSPLRLFFKKSKGFDFAFNPHSLEEEFLPPAYKMASLRRSLLTESLDRVMMRAEREGELPDPPFYDVAKGRLMEEAKKIEREKTRFSPVSKKLFSLEFTPLVSQFEEKEEGRFCHPPYPLTHLGCEIFLTGTISGISEKALFIPEKASLASAIKHLPSFLLLNSAQTPLSGLSLLFLKEGKVKERAFDEKVQLTRLIDYYFFAIENPSFLLPAWVEPYLSQDKEKLEKSIRETLNQKMDEPLLFIERAKKRPKSDELIALFSPLAQSLYQEVANGWF